MSERQQNSPDHDSAYELDLWRIHKTNPNTTKGAKAVEKLLKLHDTMLAKIANVFHQRYKHIGTFDDFLQEARIGALCAYGRFDEAKNVRNMRHYIKETVYRHLLSYTDQAGFIKVNSHQRAIRNYLDGRYDDMPQKKQAFEAKYKLHNEDLKSEFSSRYSMLVCDIISICMQERQVDAIPQADECSKHLLDSVSVSAAMRNLSSTERDVMNYVYRDGMTVKQIAEHLGCDSGQVQLTINHAKKALKELLE